MFYICIFAIYALSWSDHSKEGAKEALKNKNGEKNSIVRAHPIND